MRLPDWLLDWRNRIVASAQFQDFAATFPLTRPIAQQNASRLFDLCAGFVYTQTLYACVKLNAIEATADGPIAFEEFAARIGLPSEGAQRLAKAAAAIDVLDIRAGDRVALGELGAALLGNPSVCGMILHHKLLYDDLADPVGVLRDRPKSSALGDFWRYAGEGVPPSTIDDLDYTSLMAMTQSFVSSEILRAFHFSENARLLDIGGGGGAFAGAAASANPSLDVTTFDLPPVAVRAQQRFEAAGLAGRARAVAGDFFRDAPPGRFDVVSLVRVLHDHNDNPAQEILRFAKAALAPNGRLLVAEPLAGTRGAKRIGDAYFGIYLWTMGAGRPRTKAELFSMFKSAGFGHARELASRQPALVRIVAAQHSKDSFKA